MEFKAGESLQCYDMLGSATITCSKEDKSIIFDSFCKLSVCAASSSYKI